MTDDTVHAAEKQRDSPIGDIKHSNQATRPHSVLTKGERSSNGLIPTASRNVQEAKLATITQAGHVTHHVHGFAATLLNTRVTGTIIGQRARTRPVCLRMSSREPSIQGCSARIGTAQCSTVNVTVSFNEITSVVGGSDP